jgi:hypothetical protein
MVLILESRSHLDLGDLPNMLAAELGVMTVRLERAIRSLDDVGRVHVNRWGDGSAHLHLWFLARPYGRLQLRGTFLSLWDEILPPIPEYQWRENLALVAAWLAEFGGRPLAEPPRIDWKSPATLTPADQPVAAGDGGVLSAISGDVTSGDPADDVTSITASESAGTAYGSSDSTATAENQAGSAGFGSDAVPGDTEAPSGAEAIPVPTGPAEFADNRDFRVAPGPSGYPSIAESSAQGGSRAEEVARPVPGQRDGSTHDRDPSAASPA